MAQTTTVAVREDVYERLRELKPYESTSFSDVIAGLVEEHDNGQETVKESGENQHNVICPNH